MDPAAGNLSAPGTSSSTTQRDRCPATSTGSPMPRLRRLLYPSTISSPGRALSTRSGASHGRCGTPAAHTGPVSYTHLRAHETDSYLVCRLLLEKKKNTKQTHNIQLD